MRDIISVLILCVVIFSSLFMLIILDDVLLNNKINNLEEKLSKQLDEIRSNHGGSLKGLCSLHPECEWIELDDEPTLEGMI